MNKCLTKVNWEKYEDQYCVIWYGQKRFTIRLEWQRKENVKKTIHTMYKQHPARKPHWWLPPKFFWFIHYLIGVLCHQSNTSIQRIILHLYNHSHHHGGRKPTTILRLVKELQNCFDNLCLNTPSWPCLSCAHQCWQEMKADSHCWMTASSMSSFCLLVACSRVCASLAALASRLYFSFSMYNSLWSWSFWNGNSSWIIILF